MKLLSIIFSFKNEEKNLPELISRTVKTCSEISNWKYELIFVNDASDDSSEKIPLPPEFISERNHAIIKETQRLIESIDLSKFPVSPIDAVRNKLEQAGIKTSEITGRQYVVDYNVKTNPVLRERDADELRKPLTVQEYQDGNIDSIFMTT